MFEQADSESTRQYSGLGLGLSYAKLQAEKMGGGIRLSSTPNKGTQVWITLSLDKA